MKNLLSITLLFSLTPLVGAQSQPGLSVPVSSKGANGAHVLFPGLNKLASNFGAAVTVDQNGTPSVDLSEVVYVPRGFDTNGFADFEATGSVPASASLAAEATTFSEGVSRAVDAVYTPLLEKVNAMLASLKTSQDAASVSVTSQSSDVVQPDLGVQGSLPAVTPQAEPSVVVITVADPSVAQGAAASSLSVAPVSQPTVPVLVATVANAPQSQSAPVVAVAVTPPVAPVTTQPTPSVTSPAPASQPTASEAAELPMFVPAGFGNDFGFADYEATPSLEKSVTEQQASMQSAEGSIASGSAKEGITPKKPESSGSSASEEKTFFTHIAENPGTAVAVTVGAAATVYGAYKLLAYFEKKKALKRKLRTRLAKVQKEQRVAFFGDDFGDEESI